MQRSSLPARSTRQTSIIRAALDPSASLAVAQQTFAFAAVVGAEAAFTGLTVPADTPGRPTVPTTLAGIAATCVGGALISQGNGVGPAISFGAAAFMMLNYVQRVKDTPFNPNDWPGAKAWPATMCLITFFELAASFQGFLDAVNLLRQPYE